MRIQLPMRIVSVLNGLQPRVEVEWWRVGEEAGERRGGGKLPTFCVQSSARACVVSWRGVHPVHCVHLFPVFVRNPL